MIFFKRLALITALVGSLVGCSQSDEPTPAQQEDKSRLSLRLNVEVNSSGAPSRADKGPEDEFEPLPWKGFEEIATLRVIIFGPDGTTIRGNRMVRMSPELDDEGKLVPLNDNLVFPVESNEEVAIYLIANEASLPLPASVSSGTVSEWLDSYRVKYPSDNLLSLLDGWTAGYGKTGDVTGSVFNTGEASRLPMTERFKVTTISYKDLTEEERKSLGVDNDGSLVYEYFQDVDLFMTPAAAKVTFDFDFSALKNQPGVSGVNVTGIRFSGLGQTEYVFPTSTVYNPSKYVTTDENVEIVNPADGSERYITSFATPADNGTVNLLLQGEDIQAVPMTYASHGAKRGPYYFPEVLTKLAATAFKVEVELDGKEWFTAQPLIHNILQVDGNEAISRATHLKITIKFDLAGITYNVIVAPYNTITLDPIFGLGEPLVKP